MNLCPPLLLGTVLGTCAAHVLRAVGVSHGASVAVMIGIIIAAPVVAAIVVARRMSEPPSERGVDTENIVALVVHHSSELAPRHCRCGDLPCQPVL